MVSLRPNQSPKGPATAAPTKAPPVKTETIAPLNRISYHHELDMMWTYVSFGLGLLKVDSKDLAATTPPMTPRSYLHKLRSRILKICMEMCTQRGTSRMKQKLQPGTV